VNIAVATLSTISAVTSNPILAAGCEASLVVSYGISLRPQEYLKTPRLVPLTHQANSLLSFFRFYRVPYSMTCPDLYPPGEWPEAILFFLDLTRTTKPVNVVLALGFSSALERLQVVTFTKWSQRAIYDL
jgi:hypothetical protein